MMLSKITIVILIFFSISGEKYRGGNLILNQEQKQMHQVPEVTFRFRDFSY
jgi:hypothetical protein